MERGPVMEPRSAKKLLVIPGVALALWVGVKYLLPVLLPFLAGAGIALAAEPLVAFSQRRLKLPRVAAAGCGVTVTLILLTGLLSFAGMVLVRELGRLAGAVPDLEGTARQGTQLLQDWLVNLTERTPEGVRPMLTRTVLNFFQDGTDLMEQAARRLPALISSLLSWVPNGALGIGTGILAGFMISARLPRLKAAASRLIPRDWNDKYLPAICRVRKALGGWFRAQLKLMLVSYSIVTVGFLILRIPFGPLWGALVALVDAVPLLGTGTVLLPWALVEFLRQSHLRAAGLVCISVAAMLSRAVLEPRFLGRQLGLDPLLTLLSLYLGYRFWGLPGMLLAPILATAAKSAVRTGFA